MPLFPDDWDFLFLGGQHMQEPAPTADPPACCAAPPSPAPTPTPCTAAPLPRSSNKSATSPSIKKIPPGTSTTNSPGATTLAPESLRPRMVARRPGRRHQQYRPPVLCPRARWIASDQYWRLPFVRTPAPGADASRSIIPNPRDDPLLTTPCPEPSGCAASPAKHGIRAACPPALSARMKSPASGPAATAPPVASPNSPSSPTTPPTGFSPRLRLHSQSP